MNNLNLPQVAPNQANKELTINDQALAIDAAITESLELDASGGERVVTLKEFTRNVLFTVTAASNGAEIIVPEGVYRMFALRNRSANGIVLKSGSMTFPIPAGGGGIYHTSETVLQAVVSGATSDFDSMVEAPIDGDLYGRKDAGWEKIPESGGGGGGAPYAGLMLTTSHTGAFALSSSAYALKGLILDVSIIMKAIGVTVYIGGTGTYEIGVAKMDGALKVLDVKKVIGVVPSVAGGSYESFLMPAPLDLSPGDAMCVFAARTDGTATSASEINFPSFAFDRFIPSFGTSVRSNIRQELAGVSVNDVIEEFTSTVGAFTFPLFALEF